MYQQLKDINRRPEPFEFYTTEVLWNDPHISEKMLSFHLNETDDRASRNISFIESSVEWIVSRFQVGEGTEVCDFGCGPGLYTLRLALSGASVTGLDFSEHSIEYARKSASEAGVEIDYVLGNYLEFETGRKFDLIIMIYCDFSVLSPEQRVTLLKKWDSMLKDGGSILFDVHSFKSFDKAEEIAVYEHNQWDHFWSDEDHYAFMNIIKFPDEKVVLDKYTIFEPARTWEVYNWMQCYSPGMLREVLQGNGFEIEELLADVAGSTYDEDKDEFAVVVRKVELPNS
jgi:SAM-dependent methyltransferase